MSSLWTPEGEHPVGRPRPEAAPPPPPSGTPPPPEAPAPGRAAGETAGTEAPTEADLETLRRQLAQTPAAIIVANHAVGLYELAAVHLSLHPPQLAEASVAIDAMAALVEGMAGRLGESEPTLRDLLAQLRLAFVQIKSAAGA